MTIQQRRVVTVLFADVVGSTAIGESLDPEDLRGLLTRYFAIAREVIEEYGGTIEKFVGDAVMATFGVPRAHDDDVRRALTAALELRDRVRGDARLGKRLPIRIGVNTGEVASGVDETTGEELVTGDTVNIAARIQQGAGAWSIVVGGRTASAAGAEFTFGDHAELEARGRSATVAVRELLGPRGPSGWTTPFVGRAPDLEQLELVARRVFTEGRAWSVTIVAPPGTGKSRLLSEFLERLPRTATPPLVAQAHSLPYGQRLSYWALRPLLDDLLGVGGEATPEVLTDTATAWLTDAGAPDPRRTAELLVATVGGPSDAPPSEAELFGAWRTLIETTASRRPLVLAFEDLHWSSDSLLDLLDHALQPRRDVPALLIAVARPELLERRPGWGAGRRNQTTIDLTPLDSESMTTILRHVLADADSATVDTIVGRAEGNPFFALEMARSLQERSDGAGSAATSALDLMPDTVQATIQARIDLLAADDRRVLQAGAVFGRAFTPAGVAALTETPIERVRESLERLVDRDLLAVADDGTVHARHILIRDVAYGGLPRIDRAHAHSAAARWLATGSGSATDATDATELIAFHYREAASLLGTIDEPPPDLSEIRAQAVDWLGRAADRALRAAASSEAASHLQAAIELADAPTLPALYERLGDTNLQGQLTAESYRHAFELADQGGLSADVRLRRAGKLLMQYTRSQGAVTSRPSVEEIENLRDGGRSLLDAATDQKAIARFLIAEAFLPFWAPGAGERSEAREAAGRGLAIAEQIGDADLRSAALDALTALSETWPEAYEHARRRLEAGADVQPAEKLDAHAVVAWCASVLGRLEEADVTSAAGLALVQPGHMPTFGLHIAAWRAYVLRLLGKWDDVERVGDQALELWFATGREPAGFAVRGFVDALLVARARQNTEAARRFSDAADEILDRFPLDHPIRRLGIFIDPSGATAAGYLADVDVVLAELPVMGRADYAERAVAICADHAWRLPPNDLARLNSEARRRGCALLEAQLHRARGVAEADPAALQAALEIFEASRAQPYVARVQAELGRVRGDARLAEAGIASLTALGDVEQLDRMGARPDDR